MSESETAGRPLTLALVGLTAPHSRGWLETLHTLPEAGRLLVCDIDEPGPRPEVPEEAEAVSPEDLLEPSCRPDATLLSVRNDQAADLGSKLLAGGLPCLVEKPAGRGSGDIERLNEAAARGGTIWAPGFLNRLTPAARRIRRLVVEEQAIGRVQSIEARMVTSSVRQRNPGHWLFRREVAGGGILHWLAIHHVDLVRYLTGQEFGSVSGFTATFNREIDVEDMAAISFTLQGGALGSLHAGYVLRQRYGDIGITLRGDLGEIVWPHFDFVGRQNTLYIHSEGPRSEGPGPEVVTLEPPEGTGYGGGLGWEFVRRFAAAARMGGAFVTGGDDALRAMRFVEAAYAAARSGGRVEVGT